MPAKSRVSASALGFTLFLFVQSGARRRVQQSALEGFSYHYPILVGEALDLTSLTTLLLEWGEAAVPGAQGMKVRPAAPEGARAGSSKRGGLGRRKRSPRRPGVAPANLNTSTPETEGADSVNGQCASLLAKQE